ncbi:MAG TPA: 50S ribosomal protein L24 [Candidatus Paceibacterota bacterium]|nr:50S ribosomal protein L24 [Candidatus Paceibacterota bacterium]
MNIRKGDNVKVMKGKERGKTGKVINVDYKSGTVLIEGVNLYKKHVRAKRQGEKGETVFVARPLMVPNVMLVCPSCGRAVRVGYRIEGKTKTRYCKKCKSAF